MRREETRRPSTSWMALLLLIIAAGAFAWYTLFSVRGVDLMYEEAQALADKTAAASVKQIDLGADKPVTVASLSELGVNQTWMYVSKTAPLASNYLPEDLVDVTLPHGDEQLAMKLRGDVQLKLKALFDSAAKDDYDLMVSSAYRSVADQQKLYDNMKKTNGEAYAKAYVLDPGSSEHHTGYSLDVTDASTACEKDSDDCILSPATAAWIAENAHTYGFIVRYPSGKDSITGISHEPWHLRYVGVVLATQLYETDTTFDEFIGEVAPGRVSRQ